MAGSMSGSFSQNSSTNAYKFTLTWTIASQGIDGTTPYSNVNFALKGERLNNSYNSYNSSSSYSFTIDGASNASGSLNFDSRSWSVGTQYTLWSTSSAVRINHTSTGSKSVALVFSLATSTSGAGTVSVSGTAVLQDIAMSGTLTLGSSSLTISNSTGPTQTFTIGQYQSSYNYKVEWKIGSTVVSTTTIPANNTSTRSQVLSAAACGPSMANTNSTTVTATLYTYSGSTQIGSVSTKTFTLNYTLAPTLSSVSAAMSTTCRSYTQGLRSYYYKGQSAVVITANGFSGSNGSTLTNYTFYMGSSIVSTQTGTSWTSGTLNTVGTITFKVRATDSRGNYVEKSTSITVVDYAVPQITAKNAYRVSSGSTADSSGTKIYYTATAAATGSGNSIKTLSVATSPAATSSTASVSNSTSMSGTLNGAFSITSQYTVTFTATDAMGYSSTATVSVPTAKRIINVNQAKDGIGFGMFAESGLASFNMPIRPYKGVKTISYTSGIASVSDINTAVLNAFSSMEIYTTAWIELNPSVSIGEPFNTGSALFIEIQKTAASYGIVTAKTYSSSTGNWVWRASIWNGAMTTWVANHNATVTDTSSISGVHLKRFDCVAEIALRGASINSSGSVGTIPSLYRPSGYIYSPVIVYINSQYKPGMFTLEANGTNAITYFNGTSYVAATSGTVNGTITFLV